MSVRARYDYIVCVLSKRATREYIYIYNINITLNFSCFNGKIYFLCTFARAYAHLWRSSWTIHAHTHTHTKYLHTVLLLSLTWSLPLTYAAQAHSTEHIMHASCLMMYNAHHIVYKKYIHPVASRVHFLFFNLKKVYIFLWVTKVISSLKNSFF